MIREFLVTSVLFLVAPLSACSGGGGASDGGAGTPGAGGASGAAGAVGGGGFWSASATSCTGQTLAPAADFAAPGPFDTVTLPSSGPDGNYTVVRPERLGEGGFVHPPAAWGNGIFTIPENYPGLLEGMASHGFVVVATNERLDFGSAGRAADLLRTGLDWLLDQNEAPGDLEGKLATDCAVTVGYSLGGGAAVTVGSHAAVVATASLHGLTGPAESLSGPLLLVTSTDDGFVNKEDFVQPTYDRSSTVPTILATFEVPGAPRSDAGHLRPLGPAEGELAPTIAWLRHWVYGDEDARPWFYGSDCVLCAPPWTDVQRKNADWE